MAVRSRRLLRKVSTICLFRNVFHSHAAGAFFFLWLDQLHRGLPGLLPDTPAERLQSEYSRVDFVSNG